MALETREIVLGNEDYDTLISYYYVGFVYKEMGEITEALNYLELVLELFIKHFGGDSVGTINIQEEINRILNEYVERWELNIGTWGKKEEDACFTLLSVFQDNLLMEQASAVTSIRTMGNNLRTTARQRYTNAVGNIRQWVSGHAFYFDEKELEKIRSAILVLDRAPQKIRRDLLVEENIYNVLIKMEELVAVEYGLLCERYFRQYSFAESYDEKQASERQSIWPVHIRYDKTMKELGTVLQPLVPQTSIHKKSLFDASYSEIKLFLRVTRQLHQPSLQYLPP